MVSFLLKVIAKTPKMKFGLFLSSLGEILIESFPIVLVFGISIGMSIGLQFILALKIVGAESLASFFTTITALKEIGPMIAGSQVLMRSGTRITSEIASMRDRGILTVMEVFPLDPFIYIALPRFWGIVFATMIFSPISTLVAILSSAFLLQNIYGVSVGEIWSGIEKGGGVYEILVGLLKCFIIGISNASFSVYYGWIASEGAEGMAKAIQKSVGYAVVVAITINYSLSVVFF
jgi:phospholipid/cholesterol/gamma-HCH transport system permease protein